MKHLRLLTLATFLLAATWAIAENGRTPANIKTEVASAEYDRTGDLARQDTAILLADIASSTDAGPGSSVTLARTTAAKSADYTVATGFAHALIYIPSGVTATVDSIPLTGPTTYAMPSNFPARHATAIAITSIAGGSVYVSETR